MGAVRAAAIGIAGPRQAPGIAGAAEAVLPDTGSTLSVARHVAVPPTVTLVGGIRVAPVGTLAATARAPVAREPPPARVARAALPRVRRIAAPAGLVRGTGIARGAPALPVARARSSAAAGFAAARVPFSVRVPAQQAAGPRAHRTGAGRGRAGGAGGPARRAVRSALRVPRVIARLVVPVAPTPVLHLASPDLTGSPPRTNQRPRAGRPPPDAPSSAHI